MTAHKRKNTRKVWVGKVAVGGGAPVSVQSMTNTDTRDVRSTLNQIRMLEEAGCEIVRVGVPDMEAALNIARIKKGIGIPLVADIHFDYRLALEAVKQGVDKLRINPGNIGSPEKVREVVKAARGAGIPIRIGVNAGSLKSAQGHQSPALKAKKLVDSALAHVKILEKNGFEDIVVSLKASDVATTVEAYRLMAKKRGYPLHIGVTEAGSEFRGTIKSSVGLGILLSEGLGDTVRVSLTADPVKEVAVAYQVLQSLGLRSTGVELISCPTCSRCEVDLISIVNELEEELPRMAAARAGKKPLKIAVMGCVVNGPGEAKEADVGIAGSRKKGILFEKGRIVGEVGPDGWIDALKKLITGRSG
ncbi:MAG: flavodoxin-dependent (E)-4-hydroxy-3-methylbut-2-enyl-diphosphate synthase [Endomicrobiales bacterium]|nr:flavodoxin-dependent (E)-4-hydroxy-3-methylbut-2-enyl-diphosphate synthase [Endomicrobiales bacterium]